MGIPEARGEQPTIKSKVSVPFKMNEGLEAASGLTWPTAVSRCEQSTEPTE